ncbi:MAG: DUF1552 domain-containing protein, partial [Clostridia bacterium]|nr:DUF1552 domain-containing protein [Deltaproteobacteria bacterium]
GRSTSISLDRYLGQTIGKDLPWSQLGMGTMCDSITYSYGSDGNGVPSTRDPRTIYDNVFSSLTADPNDAAAQRRLQRRQSVLDTVAKDVTAFRARLSSEDRQRADAQLDTIRAMETRLARSIGGTGVCEAPAINPNLDYTLSDYVPETLRAFGDLAVSALACDQTRVVLMHSYLREYHPPNFKCPWSPVRAPNSGYHDLSHDTEGNNFESFRIARGFHFRIAGEIANKLKAIPEAGGTMLDNTIIYIPTEIGRGHRNDGLQFVTIGGKNLGVETGRYLYFGSDREIRRGLPHQRLLVSLLNALGLQDETFGEADGSGSGPAPNYLV